MKGTVNKMFKLHRFIDKCNDPKYDLITYFTTPKQFAIQKLRCEYTYTLWYIPPYAKTTFEYKLIGEFKTLKEANHYAYKWYVDNL